GRTDVLLVLLDAGTAAAGVFTRSKCPSAPVEWCREKLKGRTARVLVVNSGNANAFTGKSGRAACKFTAELAAKVAHCTPAQVFLASTGVIGEPLPVRQFGGVLDDLAAKATAGGWVEDAQAVLTHDHFPELRADTARLATVS